MQILLDKRLKNTFSAGRVRVLNTSSAGGVRALMYAQFAHYRWGTRLGGLS